MANSETSTLSMLKSFQIKHDETYLFKWIEPYCKGGRLLKESNP